MENIFLIVFLAIGILYLFRSFVEISKMHSKITTDLKKIEGDCLEMMKEAERQTRLILFILRSN